MLIAIIHSPLILSLAVEMDVRLFVYRIIMAAICTVPVTPEAITIRSQSRLDSCFVAIGNFCPIESIGASIIGTVVLTVVIMAIMMIIRPIARIARNVGEWASGPTYYADMNQDKYKIGASINRGEEPINTAITPSPEIIKNCTNDIKARWFHYNDNFKFNDSVDLSQIIDGFSILIYEFVKKHYPALIGHKDSGYLFWIMVFTAVLESGTHEKDDVNRATQILRQKYVT